MQVEKAVRSYAGFEPATVRFRDECSTIEQVCKLFLLGHDRISGRSTVRATDPLVDSGQT